MGLSKRQIKAVKYLNEKRRITNKEYQKEFNVSKRTATNDLNELVNKNIFEKHGSMGQGTFYKIRKAINGQTG